MKILALQGSPRPKKYTQMVLDKFLEGAASCGAECETVHLASKKINPCIGCYTCWYKTPGVCIHKDDVPDILEKLRACDVEVWATPLYHFGMTSYMKTFMERTLPLIEPFLVEHKGITSHPQRYPDGRTRKMVLVSVCGFPEVSHFDALVENFRLLARTGRKDLAGVLLRPGSEALIVIDMLGKKGEKVLQAFYRAGQEVVEKGKVSSEAEEAARQEWTKNVQGIHEEANLFWNIRMEHAKKVSRGEESRTFEEVYREDVRIILKGMSVTFKGDLFPDLRAKIQFDVTGKQPGRWYYEIQDGRCAMKEGTVDQPNLTIHTPSEVWLAVAKREIDGAQAFMERKYTVEGDIKLFLRFKELFGI